MAEKFNAMDDATRARHWDAVLLLDCDVVITAAVLDDAMAAEGEVVLTPHYFPLWLNNQAQLVGYYNAGFVLSRSREFAAWWRSAFNAHPHKFFDQGVLDDAPRVFAVGHLDERANIGHWRREDPWSVPRIPADCRFLHLHLFQDVRSGAEYELAQKNFALECIDFLKKSADRRHHEVLDEILKCDHTGFYDLVLRRKLVVLTRSEVVRAVRVVLMAKTVPRQIPVRCVIAGTTAEFTNRLNGSIMPENLELLRNESPDVFCDAEWLLAIDVDHVFQQGFFFQLWRSRLGSASNIITCPISYTDSHARYTRGVASTNILVTESVDSHVLPLTAWDLHMADPAPFYIPSLSSMQLRMEDATVRIPAAFVPTSYSDIFNGSIKIVPNCFVFHLWHPDLDESQYSGWFWKQVQRHQ